MSQKIAYSYAEAAEAVGLSERTIRRAVADGELVSHIRKGQSTPRVLHDDLVAWVESWPTERSA
jgi:excisionase family DNA binding protein